ncbi:hypothetical protein BGX38DRAFT_300287 [Terfezia claveryi]|nr:hypothetical protein BGX38DRAFT_300287 [Terfezia claveryi]
MTYALDIYFPTVIRSEPGISLELASSLNLELPDDVPAETWKELTIIRGSGLSVRMKLTWNGYDIRNDRFMELFGRVISKSKVLQPSKPNVTRAHMFHTDHSLILIISYGINYCFLSLSSSQARLIPKMILFVFLRRKCCHMVWDELIGSVVSEARSNGY